MERHLWEAVETLRRGGTILYPTDTVWGIGCDATNIEVINRVNAIKNRQQGQP
ncbi:MAG: Sua5/YciO/YrdC/YwlC family protein [Bacteroidales bacterium]|nr:Sua5/YciO/YrdC/YwlC family protein [Bacteroidales bacterium]